MALNWESQTKKSLNVSDSDAYGSHLLSRLEVQRRRLMAVSIIVALVLGVLLLAHVMTHGLDPAAYPLSTYAGQGLITTATYVIITTTTFVLAFKRIAIPMVSRIGLGLLAITILVDVALTGGLTAFLAPILLVGPAAAALILNARDTIEHAALYAAGILIIAVLQNAGALPPPTVIGQPAFYSSIAVFLSATFAAATLSFLAVRQYETADERLRALLVRSETLAQNLKAERERFADFSDVASDWLFEVDTSGIVTYSAGRYMASLGTGSARVVGLHYSEIVDLSLIHISEPTRPY